MVLWGATLLVKHAIKNDKNDQLNEFEIIFKLKPNYYFGDKVSLLLFYYF